MTRATLLLCLLLAACSKHQANAHDDSLPATSASAAAPATTSPHASATASASATPGTASSATAPATSASAAASAAPSTKGKAPASLAGFLPASLGGTKLDRQAGGALLGDLPGGAAFGSYLDMKHHKAININLMPVEDLATARAQLHGLKPGQVKKEPAAHVEFKAFRVKGFTVVRTKFSGAKKSEAFALVADKVTVRLSVQPTNDPDQAVTLMKDVDLRGIAAFAKKHL